MKVLHFVILLCVLAFPLRAFAAAPDLPALLFVEAAASEAAYSGELSELLRARLTAARRIFFRSRGRSAAAIYGRICG